MLAGGQLGNVQEREPFDDLEVVDEAMLERAKRNLAEDFTLILSDKVNVTQTMVWSASPL